MSSIIRIDGGSFILPFTNFNVTINGAVFNNPIAKGRLLTVGELERINSYDLSNPVSRFVIEDEIVDSTFEEFIGIGSNIDWKNIDAGIFDTYVNSVVSKSMQYATDPIGSMNESYSSVNVLNSIQAIVSRFLSTPFSEVEKLPINELFRRYAICLAAFPNEVKPIEMNNAGQESDD